MTPKSVLCSALRPKGPQATGGGRKAEDPAREVGLSKHTVYAWEREVRRDGRDLGAGSDAVA